MNKLVRLLKSKVEGRRKEEPKKDSWHLDDDTLVDESQHEDSLVRIGGRCFEAYDKVGDVVDDFVEIGDIRQLLAKLVESSEGVWKRVGGSWGTAWIDDLRI